MRNKFFSKFEWELILKVKREIRKELKDSGFSYKLIRRNFLKRLRELK